MCGRLHEELFVRALMLIRCIAAGNMAGSFEVILTALLSNDTAIRNQAEVRQRMLLFSLSLSLQSVHGYF